MPATIILRKEEYKVEDGLTVRQALEMLGLLPESYLVVREGDIIEDNGILQNGDVLTLVPAISGGLN